MQLAPAWHISKDNTLKVNPYELRQLKGRYKLTGRTLHVECPQYDQVDQRTARAIATMSLPEALIGGCGYINVRGPRWNYEFKTKELNSSIERQWPGRYGMVQNPAEKVLAGCFYDETRKLFQVPHSYNIRETVKFESVTA